MLDDVSIIKMIDTMRREHSKRKRAMVEFALNTDGALSVEDVMKMPYMYRQHVYPVLVKRSEAMKEAMNK